MASVNVIFKAVKGKNFTIHENAEKGIEIFGYTGKKQANGKLMILSPNGEEIFHRSIPKVKKIKTEDGSEAILLSPSHAIILFCKSFLKVNHFEKSLEYEGIIFIQGRTTKRKGITIIITKDGNLKKQNATPKHERT